MSRKKKQKTSSLNTAYLCVESYKNKILCSFLDLTENRRYYETVDWKPKLYFDSRLFKNKDITATYKSLDGTVNFVEKRFSIYDYYKTLDKIGEKCFSLKNHVGGNISPHIQFINEVFSDHQEISFDYSKIVVCYLDIETGPGANGGFPDVNSADGQILSITLKYNNYKDYIVFGMKDYEVKEGSNIHYVKCENEKQLLIAFLEIWRKRYPDVITGWFISTFDMPYLFNRITAILGPESANSLSPFKVCALKKDFDPINKNIYEDRQIVHIYGINELDYVRLYKKFASLSERESYSLNYIAELELGEKKLEYEGSLFDLYQNDFQTFIDYNIKDVGLIVLLEEKLKLIQLTYFLAYYSRTNFRDVFFQVRMWDSIIYNYLKKNNIVIPYQNRDLSSSAHQSFEGAYVKNPQTGFQDWVVSFDVNSLYPHIILQYNISPETLVNIYENEENSSKGYRYFGFPVHQFLSKEIPEDLLSFIKQNDLSMVANGATFKKNQMGILPKLITTLSQERKKYKSLYIQMEQKYEETGDPKYKQEAIRYNILQNVKKICLNSAYGAMGNPYFRYYDIILASSVTLTGQLIIQWIEKSCNEFLNNEFKTEGIDYCIAIDTDSVYLNFSKVAEFYPNSDKNDLMDKIEKINKKLLSYVDNKLNELKDYLNCKENQISIKREVIADKGIFLAKKKYCLNVLDSEHIRYHEPKLKLMGVEAIKSSTPSISRKFLKDLIAVVLREDNEALLTKLEDLKTVYKNSDLLEIAFPRSVNQMEKYQNATKSIPIHVYGALVFNRYIASQNKKIKEIISGDKIKFVYLKKPNKWNSHVMSFPSSGIPESIKKEIMENVDIDTMIKKSFLDPLSIITEKIDWNLEKKSTLVDFLV